MTSERQLLVEGGKQMGIWLVVGECDGIVDDNFKAPISWEMIV